MGRLWGVGAKSEQRLQCFGIRTIGQLLDYPEQFLVQQFGDLGRHVWQLAHAQDDRRVVPDREAKSISTETTFAHDIGDRRDLSVWLLDLVEHLTGRLRHHRLQARTLDIKMRSADFRTQLRQQALAEPTNQTNALWRAAKTLFERSLTPDLLPVRLHGVGASRLTHDDLAQGSLLDNAVDAIRDQFGGAAIRRGSFLDRPGKPARLWQTRHCDACVVGIGYFAVTAVAFSEKFRNFSFRFVTVAAYLT